MKSSTSYLLMAVLMAAAFYTLQSSCTAQWSADPAVNNPICTTGYNYQPVMISDGAGGSILAWTRRNENDTSIYAQRISADGVAMWGTNGMLICTTPHILSFPNLISDGAGGAIIIWLNYQDTTTGIYAQRFDPGGAPLWAGNAVLIRSVTTEIYGGPAVTDDGSRGAIAAWTEKRNGIDYGIYAQKIDSSGTLRWVSTGQTVADTFNSQRKPLIRSDGAGGAFISWTDDRNCGVDLFFTSDIYAQHLDASGTLLWSSQGAPVYLLQKSLGITGMVPDDAGGVILVWVDYRNMPIQSAYTQRLNAEGIRQWIIGSDDSDGVQVYVETQNQDYP